MLESPWIKKSEYRSKSPAKIGKSTLTTPSPSSVPRIRVQEVEDLPLFGFWFAVLVIGQDFDINHQGNAGYSPWFHLPGSMLGTHFRPTAIYFDACLDLSCSAHTSSWISTLFRSEFGRVRCLAMCAVACTPSGMACSSHFAACFSGLSCFWLGISFKLGCPAHRRALRLVRWEWPKVPGPGVGYPFT